MKFITPDPAMYRISECGRFVIKKNTHGGGSSVPPTYELYMYQSIAVGIPTAIEAASEATRVANEKGEVG